MEKDETVDIGLSGLLHLFGRFFVFFLLLGFFFFLDSPVIMKNTELEFLKKKTNLGQAYSLTPHQ